MKLCLTLLVSAAAFAPNLPMVARAPALRGVYEDAVSEAQSAAKKFGASSAEAKTAWAEVEEIEASDNSASLKPTLDEECDPNDPSCRDYQNSMEELAALIATSKAKSYSMKVQLAKFSSEPLPVSAGTSPAESPQAKAAVAAAEAAAAEFGATSSEAKAAWAVVEEINDSLDAPAAALPGLDQACISAAVAKCAEFDKAMDSLDEALTGLAK